MNQTLATARQVSAFVSQNWSSVYLSRPFKTTDEGEIWTTWLHSPDGPKVFTLVRDDGTMEDRTR